MHLSARRLFAAALLTMLPLGAAHADLYRHIIAATEGQEVPPPGTPTGGTATGVVSLNTSTNQLAINVTFQNLSGPATLAHFHGFAPPGVATGVKYDLTSFISNGPNTVIGVVSYPEADEPNILAGLLYFNIHTSANPSGQVRDQITLQPIPAANPALLAMMAGLTTLAGGVFLMRRRNGLA